MVAASDESRFSSLIHKNLLHSTAYAQNRASFRLRGTALSGTLLCSQCASMFLKRC